jgi:hypothetical protein
MARRRNPPATGMLRLAAAILFIAGPIVALVFRSWGHGVRSGAIVLGIRGRSSSATIAASVSSE